MNEIIHSDPEVKNFKQNLAFSMSEATLFSRKLASQLILTFFIYYFIGSRSKFGSGARSGTVMHSGSVSKTLPQRSTREKRNQFVVKGILENASPSWRFYIAFMKNSFVTEII
jgi:hypothetical protein